MTLTEWGPSNLFADLGLVNKPAAPPEGHLCSEWHILILQNIYFILIFCNETIPVVEFRYYCFGHNYRFFIIVTDTQVLTNFHYFQSSGSVNRE